MAAAERGPESRPALSRCIGIPAQRFADEVWARSALLSRAHELPSGFDDLFGADAVDELVTRRGVRTPFIRMARDGTVLPAAAYTGSGGYGAEVGDQVASDRVFERFAEGATIVLQGLHRLWPPIIDFTRRLADELRHPVQVNAYVTPPSAQGFDPHYDTHDVFVLQVSGEKHWRIHAPVHPDPLASEPWSGHAGEVAEAALGEPVVDAVLRPGDALYLPRGWIHSATAGGDATSVHLTVGISTTTRADVVSALVARIDESERLRASLPLGIDVADPAQFAEVFRETVEALTEFIGAADAAGTADALARRFERDIRPEPVAPLATLAAMTRLDGSSTVRWRDALHARVERDGDRVRIVTQAKTLSLPAEAEEAVRRLVAGDPIAVGELPGLDSESAVVVARRLVREGFAVTPAVTPA
ncbi:ribosomal protein L16 Arg81 hydroxylase [Agromyces terreus]|uniref:Ribosomal protein L16 Arg81 hydroxylase n=1 Tax=Agromyces terreus TaxID=424795 RepID=A0A9X2H5C1_9MICO|nr:cupin domain-containing protein [Agromyces terreus]MCP2369689.1 ribosomal protein L16 Arg81 hydroxylase [Agromyces terreus]